MQKRKETGVRTFVVLAKSGRFYSKNHPNTPPGVVHTRKNQILMDRDCVRATLWRYLRMKGLEGA